MSLTPEAVAHVFNDDLLINDSDVERSQVLFPKLPPVLDFPELRALFRQYDEQALAARRRAHRWGLVAILFGFIALMSSALAPIAELPPIGEIVGFSGLLIGAGGMWLFNFNHVWMVSRLMTERLRQWHFQFLVQRGDLVSAVIAGKATKSSVAAFREKRARLFEEFLKNHQGKLDSILTALTDSDSDLEAWIVCASAPNNGYEQDESFEAVCAAYRTLRLVHQAQYAHHKLRTRPEQSMLRFFRWPIVAQSRALHGLESFCFFALVALAPLVVFNYAWQWFIEGDLKLSPLTLNVFALGVAIVGFAARTLEEGLGLEDEVARYREYRSRLQRLVHDFDRSPEIHHRLHVMREMEVYAFDELRHFLIAHHESKFLL